jgi:hypothetical protein
MFHINTELEEKLFYTRKSSSIVYKNNNLSSRQNSDLQIREIPLFILSEVAGLTTNELQKISMASVRKANYTDRATTACQRS